MSVVKEKLILQILWNPLQKAVKSGELDMGVPIELAKIEDPKEIFENNHKEPE